MSEPILNPMKMKALTIQSHRPAFTGDVSSKKMSVLSPKIQKSLTLEKEKRSVNIGRSFHLKAPIFPNIILTKDEDIITTYAIEGATMIEKMMANILNRTIALDNYGDDDDDIYFVKKEGFLEEDITNLKKYVDISERHIDPYGKEICIQAAKTKLCGLSGLESIENQHVDGLKIIESRQEVGTADVEMR